MRQYQEPIQAALIDQHLQDCTCAVTKRFGAFPVQSKVCGVRCAVTQAELKRAREGYECRSRDDICFFVLEEHEEDS